MPREQRQATVASNRRHGSESARCFELEPRGIYGPTYAAWNGGHGLHARSLGTMGTALAMKAVLGGLDVEIGPGPKCINYWKSELGEHRDSELPLLGRLRSALLSSDWLGKL